MSQIRIWLTLVIGSALLVSGNETPTAMLTESDLPMMTSSIEMDGKPARPRLFQSPEQIRLYLDTLGKYYTYHNRNRFGKRMSRPVMESVREPYDDNSFNQKYDPRSTF